jgi:hypothetical protein
MEKSAGQLLAELLKAREEGKDTAQLEVDFEKQSLKQLTDCNPDIEVRSESVV